MIKRKDVLADMEKVVGKHWSEFDNTENGFSLLFQMNENERLEKEFKNAKDTYFSMEWDEFKSLLKYNGFKEGLSYDFTHEEWKCTEEFMIYYHTKGIIICATSFNNKTTVNGGTAYLETKGMNFDKFSEIMSTGGCFDSKNDLWNISNDVREGLFQWFNIVDKNTEIIPIWKDADRFLWFLDFVESKKENYDYKAITQEKIKRASKECQDILRCCIK